MIRRLSLPSCIHLKRNTIASLKTQETPTSRRMILTYMTELNWLKDRSREASSTTRTILEITFYKMASTYLPISIRICFIIRKRVSLGFTVFIDRTKEESLVTTWVLARLFRFVPI